MLRRTFLLAAVLHVALLWAWWAAAAAPAAEAPAAKPPAAKSVIDTVTVYRGQALVTRLVDLPADTGDLQVVVDDLPAAVIGSSLSASAEGADLLIRSVRFRSQPVATAVSKEVADLDAAIKGLHQDLYANEQYQKLLDAKATYLDRLEQFAAPPAFSDAAKGTLKPEVIEQVTGIDYVRRTEIVKERIELVQKAEALKERLALAERQRGELSKAAEKSVNEAVLFVAKSKAGAAKLRLQYMVGSADWSPSYNAILSDDGKTVRLEYLADIRQQSGEDWSGVKLTLSTATPQLAAESPVLGPLWISLSTPAPSKGADKVNSLGAYSTAQESVRTRQRAAAVEMVENKKAMAAVGWDLNRLASEGQYLELNAGTEVIRGGRQMVAAAEEGLAVSYPLEGKMNLASRADRQLVQIAQISLPGKTYYEAAPLLTNYVGHCARMTNSGTLPLLAGPYSAYIAGEFVGAGQLPVVAQGQEFTVGFGVDTQLRCHRELIDKSDSTSWGNRVQGYHYRLRLENFKATPVEVRLLDRMPASKSEDVKITLGTVSAALSGDEVYVRDMKPAGILRWEITLPANSAGAKAKDIDYTFEVKYAKDKAVGFEAVPLEQENLKAYDMFMTF